MPGDKTIEPEINIVNNWHIIPTSGDLLANDTESSSTLPSLPPISYDILGDFDRKWVYFEYCFLCHGCTFDFQRVRFDFECYAARLLFV